MRILVTGGSGFIGSHLCEKLLEADHEVICLDNFFCSDEENISHLIESPRFKLVCHDVTEPIRLEVDRIYNLACPASPVHYQLNPVKTVETNVIGMLNMLTLAKVTGARLLQASTSEVYGDPQVHPQPESYWGYVNPIGLRSCYDEGKRVAETLCMDYHRQHRVDVRIARIFNTYGPRMAVNDGRVVSNFIVQALRGEDITVYGEGNQSRSFAYVSDLVEGLIRLMNTDAVIGPVNLGNPDEITILELARQVITLSASKSQIRFEPLPEDDPRQRRPDISLARKLLGWEPTVPLVEGLTRTIDYFSRKLGSSAGRSPVDGETLTK